MESKESYGESEQPQNDLATQWSELGKEVPFAGAQNITDNVTSPETSDIDSVEEAPSILSMKAMRQHAEAAGYQPKLAGEQSLLSINQDGKTMVESAYRQVWSEAAADDPDFYNDAQNQAFSVALWNVGNAAMFEDLDPDATKDSFPKKLWDECVKLNNLLSNPEYNQRATEFLEQLEQLGQSGAKAQDAIEAIQTYNERRQRTESAPVDTELQRKQQYYNQFNAIYQETMSKDSLDSDDLEELAEGFADLGDYADAAERAKDIRTLLNRLEAISQLD